jgi:hypothetical protein
MHAEIETDAECRTSIISRDATLVLATDWAIRKISDAEVSWVARHECVHLLLSPMVDLMGERYISKDAITNAEEATVIHLQGLLP